MRSILRLSSFEAMSHVRARPCSYSTRISSLFVATTSTADFVPGRVKTTRGGKSDTRATGELAEMKMIELLVREVVDAAESMKAKCLTGEAKSCHRPTRSQSLCTSVIQCEGPMRCLKAFVQAHDKPQAPAPPVDVPARTIWRPPNSTTSRSVIAPVSCTFGSGSAESDASAEGSSRCRPPSPVRNGESGGLNDEWERTRRTVTGEDTAHAEHRDSCNLYERWRRC